MRNNKNNNKKPLYGLIAKMQTRNIDVLYTVTLSRYHDYSKLGP